MFFRSYISAIEKREWGYLFLFLIFAFATRCTGGWVHDRIRSRQGPRERW